MSYHQSLTTTSSVNLCDTAMVHEPGFSTVRRYTDEILEQSDKTAAWVSGRLDAIVPTCPTWRAADLIAHLIDVHWFWRTIVEEELTAPPAAERRPVRPHDGDLIATYVAGATSLAEVLTHARQQQSVWTWSTLSTVSFITRHQVQEAAVHAYDAAAVAERPDEWHMPSDLADDAIEEFCTYSVSARVRHESPRAPLGAPLVLHDPTSSSTWTLRDRGPDALVWRRGDANVGTRVSAPSPTLLLWLYQRVTLEVDDEPIVRRFREFTSTD